MYRINKAANNVVNLNKDCSRNYTSKNVNTFKNGLQRILKCLEKNS